MKIRLGLAACLTIFSPAQQPDLSALARQALAAYHDPDRDTELSGRIHLELAAGDWEGALDDISASRILRASIHPARALYAYLPQELYARARQQAAKGGSFEASLKQDFARRLAALDARGAFQAGRAFDVGLGTPAQTLPQRPLSTTEIVDIARAMEDREVFEQVLPLAKPLLAEDDARRYEVREELIPTTDGATISALVVLPKGAAKPLPTALEFTIYAADFNLVEAKRSAANGFAGVTANSRGKRGSRSEIAPYEHDGADADAVIEWIAKQPWSDGQVGMFGGSYDGFTQWAAAKRPPKALRSLMPSVTAAPGIDVPMQGGIFENFAYKWLPYVTNNRMLDEASYNDSERWNGLDWAWFGDGHPYRDLPKLDGHLNPIFLRWLEHPGYDAYWQAMIPYRQDFAGIRIPVLTTTGYFDGGQLGALYYFQQHTAFNPSAEHYLLIGPYDHIRAQRRSQEVLAGYRIDPAARIDIEELRYQWLDHTLRGGPKPALLQDRVNYEILGANRWGHAPSLEAMGDATLTLYPSPLKAEDGLLLSPAPVKGNLDLRVDLAGRRVLSFGGQPPVVQDKTLDSDNGFAFYGEPLAAPLEVGGLFSGELRFIVNKRDFDFDLQLYEQSASGDYLLLSYLTTRASYTRDRSRRQLFHPGRLETLPFQSGRLASCRLQAGSRLVVVFKVDKGPHLQVNYGTGGDVSSESAKDAREPLKLSLHPGTFIRIPIRR
ncbi:MAG TPA: CocE/NonD family hydrolase [Holophagaceae bacterium]|jgi:putative CocE/NonD family hydrolase|nr:CocE/NonD family hydrolase [Holophagaceae bacterium]